MRKNLLFLIIFLLPITGFGQYNSSVGLTLGVSNYLGEIGGNAETGKAFIGDLKLSQSNLAIGGLFRYKFTPLISTSLHFDYVRISGADSLTEFHKYSDPGMKRAARNLSFRNDIYELTSRLELVFFGINDIGSTGRYVLDFKAYVFLGLGVFMHNPKARTEYDNKWHELRPLRTEAQDKEYSKFGLTIPQGFGFYYTYRKIHRFGAEFAWRTTFTDYIDDVSTTFAGDAAFEEGSLSQELHSRTEEIENYDDI
ncbi:MAG: hypothetical protein HRT72_09190, partial [Flavobacteriales bacterium]|nr:hypothetical protein [Flavobacteriales bacterium]